MPSWLATDHHYVAGLPAKKRQLLASFSRLQGTSTDDVTRQRWPVVIVGAGPSGAAATITLSRQSCPVLLLDRRAPPREKVCGDGLITDSHDALQGLGLLDEVRAVGHSTTAGHIVSPAGNEVSLSADFTTLERHLFDGMLLRESVAAGATFQVARVRAVEPGADGLLALRIDGLTQPILAEYVVLATGATATPCGNSSSPPTSAIAARCYVRSRQDKDRLLMCFGSSVPHGYGWVFPMGEGIYNVGVIQFLGHEKQKVSVRDSFREFVTTAPSVSELWRDSVQLTPLRGAPLSCGLELTHANPMQRVAATGESTATTFPFTGEGIGKALQSGILVAEQIKQALDGAGPVALGAYADTLNTALRPSYRGFELAQRCFGLPWVYDILVRRMGRSAAFRSLATGVLTGDARMDELFSVKNVFRSLWR